MVSNVCNRLVTNVTDTQTSKYFFEEITFLCQFSTMNCMVTSVLAHSARIIPYWTNYSQHVPWLRMSVSLPAARTWPHVISLWLKSLMRHAFSWWLMLVCLPSAHQNRHGARPRVSRRLQNWYSRYWYNLTSVGSMSRGLGSLATVLEVVSNVIILKKDKVRFA